MTETERAILDALTDLEQAAAAARDAAGSTGAKPAILPILERIDRLAGTLPENTPGDLRHYLTRKSYEKARLFLLGRDAENARGRCGH